MTILILRFPLSDSLRKIRTSKNNFVQAERQSSEGWSGGAMNSQIRRTTLWPVAIVMSPYSQGCFQSLPTNFMYCATAELSSTSNNPTSVVKVFVLFLLVINIGLSFLGLELERKRENLFVL